MKQRLPFYILGSILLIGTILITTFAVRSATAPCSASSHRVSLPLVIQQTNTQPQSTTHYTYNVLNTYPHDPGAFTQGLIYEQGTLYEGTGLYGESSLRRVDLTTGEVSQQHNLDEEYFGEGITIYGDRIVQLTWQENTGFVYNKDSFELICTFEYPTEGWGITHDGKRLIVSDGTSTLYFWDPHTLAEIGRITVSDSGTAIDRINELEYIGGEIYANIWQTDQIVRIDPQTGQVRGWIDLTSLLPDEDHTQTTDVLNGIAYDAENDRLFVTGKLWPKLFEIELAAIDQTSAP
ncbi:MAG: glutaminyl-peptide cyclotransferase [Chloroflexi bacterium AL-N10]|nr:glutaminyl-peptide cyclotransferase [Chloroflexi bacterium AL-N1]NOK71082.1 glutaminyl-peptide cyclotransferase [Chloroflexi bacterium AL-N10]NOK77329.1 glutaminyl-peptide cyclotransferase [Chloroflexi bacterium AL-N5]